EGQPKRFTQAALERLASHHWPGNVRELRNAVQRAYVMAPGEMIDGQWLPGSLPNPAPPDEAAPRPTPKSNARTVVVPVGASMAEAERALILATLQHYKHQKERVASVLGISLKTLYNR